MPLWKIVVLTQTRGMFGVYECWEAYKEEGKLFPKLFRETEFDRALETLTNLQKSGKTARVIPSDFDPNAG